jgi:transposase
MFDYTGKTIFLGIDVHKSTYSVTAISDGEVIKRDKMTASPEILVNYCKKYFKNAHIKSAYEAGFSGFYLHRYLLQNGIKNIVIHAASIEISSRDCVKTDKRDSFKIASHLSCNRLRPIFVPSINREDQRNLTRLREVFIKQRTRTACQLKALLNYHGLILPGRTPAVSERWIEGLKNLDMSPNLRNCIERYSATWRHFNDQIKQLNKEIKQSLSSCEKLMAIYCSVPGIGVTAGSILLNELGNTLQFSNEEKLFSHVGLTPREYSSGEHVRQGNISKQGKPILRRILVQASWKAIKIDSSLNAIFERISKRAGKKRAIVAIARILLGRIRSCMKRQSPYYTLKDVKEKPNELTKQKIA